MYKISRVVNLVYNNLINLITGSDSWSSGNWKDGLSSVVQKNIAQLEAQAEKLKREKDQKQFQLESLEQVRDFNKHSNILKMEPGFSFIKHLSLRIPQLKT